MTDAIGVKKALENNKLSRYRLIELRNRIDVLAREYLEISFISFADSILLKSNWTIGSYKNDMSYTYKPEVFIDIIIKLQSIYKSTLNLDMYAILTQGGNEYYDDSLLHISDTNNHISLNSLGVPFADLMSIEEAVRISIRKKTHMPADVYKDQKFYHSLNLKHGFKKNDKEKYPYNAKMVAGDSFYFPNNLNTIKVNIDNAT